MHKDTLLTELHSLLGTLCDVNATRPTPEFCRTLQIELERQFQPLAETAQDPEAKPEMLTMPLATLRQILREVKTDGMTRAMFEENKTRRIEALSKVLASLPGDSSAYSAQTQIRNQLDRVFDSQWEPGVPSFVDR